MTRIMVVEDEESFSEALSFMLRREGYEVEVAGDGNTAMDDLAMASAFTDSETTSSSRDTSPSVYRGMRVGSTMLRSSTAAQLTSNGSGYCGASGRATIKRVQPTASPVLRLRNRQ